MSIWLKKEDKVSSFTPITDVIVPVASAAFSVVAFKAGIDIAFVLVATPLIGMLGVVVGRVWFVRRMKREGWE